MATKFFYMDEQYIPGNQASRRRQCTCLTGVLIPSDTHGEFRRRFYKAVAVALGIKDNIIPVMPKIHASNLFPDHGDDVKFQFLEEIVTICADFNFRIFRVGYFETPKIIKTFKDQKRILGLCFLGLLWCLEDELVENEIWPVMEIDNTPEQDHLFAGHIKNIDYLSSMIGK